MMFVWEVCGLGFYVGKGNRIGFDVLEGLVFVPCCVPAAFMRGGDEFEP
jgi:hypothetical protein